MIYVLTFLVIAGVFAQNMSDKLFAVRIVGSKSVQPFYCFCSACFFFLSVIVYGVLTGGYSFVHLPTVGMGTIFGVSSCVSIILTAYLIQTGPMGFVALINSFAPLIPTLFGFFILSEPLRESVLIGIVLLVVSLLLINLKKEGRMKPHWLMLALLAFVMGGTCSTVQTYHQNIFHAYGVLFMTVGTFISVLICAGYCWRFRKDVPKTISPLFFALSSVKGIASAMVNFLVIYLVQKMPASVLFPVVSAGGVVVSMLASRFLFKETMTGNQKVGFFCGL